MVKLFDDNQKEVIFNEKHIVAVHKYDAANGSGVALKVMLNHTGYLGLWYATEEKATNALGILMKAIARVK